MFLKRKKQRERAWKKPDAAAPTEYEMVSDAELFRRIGYQPEVVEITHAQRRN